MRHGRIRGATNKQKREFRAALLAYCADKNVDPFYWMVDLLAAKGVKRELKFQAAKELAQYLQPKLRAVELSSDPESPLQFRTVLTTALEAALEDAYADRNGAATPR